jgi:hypothetical protein
VAPIVSRLNKVDELRLALALLPKVTNNGVSSVVPVYEEMALVKSVAMATP